MHQSHILCQVRIQVHVCEASMKEALSRSGSSRTVISLTMHLCEAFNEDALTHEAGQTVQKICCCTGERRRSDRSISTLLILVWSQEWREEMLLLHQTLVQHLHGLNRTGSERSWPRSSVEDLWILILFYGKLYFSCVLIWIRAIK